MHGWRLFFFFKQKTAYEMRISDWSSDVCSSDLDAACPVRQHEQVGVRDRELVAEQELPSFELLLDQRIAAVQVREALLAHFGKGRRIEPDRKSVVEGKSVSVRVVLGGRRIIPKETHRHVTASTTTSNKLN